MDVVVVTLGRNTLGDCINAIQKTIQDSHINLVMSRNTFELWKDYLWHTNNVIVTISEFCEIGALRNKSISLVKTPIFAFIDDDVIVTKEWFKECMKHIDEYDMVSGTYYPFGGMGANICKTDSFKKYPFSQGLDTPNPNLKTLQLNVRCKHLQFKYIRHILYWIGKRCYKAGIIWTFKDSLKSLFIRHDFFMFCSYSILFVNAVITKALG